MRIALALLALLVAAPAAAADTDLGTLDHDTPVATFGGRAAWSAYDPVARRYALMTWTAEAGVQAVPVPSRAAAFDVDLGPSAAGAVTAVYSRAGRLYSYDFAGGGEQRLPLRGHAPTLFRSRVAFLRGRTLRSAGLDGEKPRVLAPKLRRGFGSFDIADHRLAYVMTFGAGEGRAVELRVRNLRTGRDRLVNRSSSGALSHVEITGVNFDRASELGAIKVRRGAAGDRLLRFKTRLAQSPGPANVLDGGLTGGHVFYLQAADEFSFSCADAGAGPCHLKVG
jgi:hypothetical protein